jgi:hypothetical protein
MTFNVYYTERAQPTSSLVKRAWYDSNSQRLALELHGSVYEYTGVPEWVYQSLVLAVSPGRYYGDKIKPNYGPGSRLGPVSDLREIASTGRFATVPAVRADAGYAPVFDLDAKRVQTGVTPQLSLTKDVDTKPVGKVEYDHTVYFVLEDGSDERAHTFKATSLDDAVEKMFDLADLLDQDIEVKGVLVRFE